MKSALLILILLILISVAIVYSIFYSSRCGINILGFNIGTRCLNEEVCIQVITQARNLKTGEVKYFPTPCDVPDGWIKI